jgi:outer membrane lipoprotein-sorting protein
MMKRSKLLLLSMLGALPMLSCSDFWPTDEPEVSAETRFQELERRLLEAETIYIDGGAGSTGTVESAFEGKVILASGNRARIQFTGQFASKNVLVALVSDGTKMWAGNGSDSFEEEAPAALNEGIIVGLTRMGILHNLAVLSEASAPEGTDGNVHEWLTVTNFAWGDEETIDGVITETMTFDISVDGKPSAKARLWLNKETGLPVQRQQVVQFPDGEMTAVEVYEAFEIDAPFDSEKFVVP